MPWLIKPFFILAAVVVAFIAFQVIDRVALPQREGRVCILQKFYRELRVATTYTRAGSAMRPITTEQPEAWVLKIEMDGKELEATVPKDVFERVNRNDSVTIRYKQHRLRRSIEIVGTDGAGS